VMERDRIEPRVGQLLEEGFRRVDHQMSVEDEVRPWSKRGNEYRAQRDGRDEVAIHDVDMDDVGIGFDELDLVGKVGEVRCEDGCRQLPHGGGL
jgi:hypothetical protein